MAIGIAGDSYAITSSLLATASLSNAQALDLLTQILIELRTNTVIAQTGLNVTDDLNNIRNDQDMEIVSGSGYGQG